MNSDDLDRIRFPFLYALVTAPSRLTTETPRFHERAPEPLVSAIHRICDTVQRLLGYRPGVVIFEPRPADWVADISPRGKTSADRERDLAALVGHFDRELLGDPAASNLRWEFLVNGKQTPELHTSRPWGTAKFHIEPSIDLAEIVFRIQKTCEKDLGREPFLAIGRLPERNAVEISVSYGDASADRRLEGRLRSLREPLALDYSHVKVALSVAGKPLSDGRELLVPKISEVDLANEDFGLDLRRL